MIFSTVKTREGKRKNRKEKKGKKKEKNKNKKEKKENKEKRRKKREKQEEEESMIQTVEKHVASQVNSFIVYIMYMSTCIYVRHIHAGAFRSSNYMSNPLDYTGSC